MQVAVVTTREKPRLCSLKSRSGSLEPANMMRCSAQHRASSIIVPVRSIRPFGVRLVMISHQMQKWAPRLGSMPLRPAPVCRLSAQCQLTRGFCAHVQFKAFRYHDYGLRAVSTLPHCEFEGLSPVNKQAAAQTAGVLDNPVSVAVFADQEGGERCAAHRRRFTFTHGIGPFAAQARAMISSPGRGFKHLSGRLARRWPVRFRDAGVPPLPRSRLRSAPPNCARAHMNSREIKVEFHKKCILISRVPKNQIRRRPLRLGKLPILPVPPEPYAHFFTAQAVCCRAVVGP